MFINNVHITARLVGDRDFLNELFHKLKHCCSPVSSSDVNIAKNLFGFLKEFFIIGRTVKGQVDIFSALSSHGIFEIVESAALKWCPANDEWAWLAIVSIIQNYLNADPDFLRTYLNAHMSDHKLLSRLLYIASTKEIPVCFYSSRIIFKS